MQTSLQAIAKKAARNKEYRFENLFCLLNEENTLDSWKLLNKKAAYGVDKVSAKEFGENLLANVVELIGQVKQHRYRARLVRRQYIPKANGKLRPLGIPATADKILQKVVARILEAIYEQDFLKSSYGYRPKQGPLDAAWDLCEELQYGRYEYLVEADIRGYFDSIDHSIMLDMLKQRINDKPFLGLIEKWLKAGVLDTNGEVIEPLTGVPQGGIVSPVLSNVYLHYALDKWFEEVVKKHCRGSAYHCRFADDFVCAFQHREDAERFYKVLGMRLKKFGLELATEKTKIIDFSPFRKEKPSSFEFLGFEYSWGVTRNGKRAIQRRTARKKLRSAKADFTGWIKENRNEKLRLLIAQLNAKLRGYYNYYGVINNYASLLQLFRTVVFSLKKWLNRRSQRRSYQWQSLDKALKYYKLARPWIAAKPYKARSVTNGY
jgi:RNA-directed DNA polymerase